MNQKRKLSLQKEAHIRFKHPEFRLEQKEFEYLFTKEYASQLFNFTKKTLQWYIQKFNCKNC